MIYTSIHTDYQNQGMHHILVEVLDYLKETDFSKIGPGRYPFKDYRNDEIAVNVFEVSTEPFEKRFGESHKKYLDVQFIVEGEEKFGFATLTDEYDEEYDDATDFISYKEVNNEGYLVNKPGNAAIFFPADIHKPSIAVNKPSPIKKVVVKVRVDLLK